MTSRKRLNNAYICAVGVSVSEYKRLMLILFKDGLILKMGVDYRMPWGKLKTENHRICVDIDNPISRSSPLTTIELTEELSTAIIEEIEIGIDAMPESSEFQRANKGRARSIVDTLKREIE